MIGSTLSSKDFRTLTSLLNEFINACKQQKFDLITELVAIISAKFHNKLIKKHFTESPDKDRCLLKLIDLYLRNDIQCTWQPSGIKPEELGQQSRDQALGYQGADILQQQQQQLLTSLVKVIIHINPEFTEVDQEQLSLKFKSYYEEATTTSQNYVCHDWSDDSDSEDEKLFTTPKQTTPAQKQRHAKFQRKQEEIVNDPKVWQKMRRSTVRKAGITDKLAELQQSEALSISEIDKVINAIKSKAREKRSTLPKIDDDTIPQYIALFRGINYIEGRWTNLARRLDYNTNRTGTPLLAESAYKASSYNPYTEHSPDKLPINNPRILNQLVITATTIQQQYQQLIESGFCIEETVPPCKKGHYLFNSKADKTQHDYSNGIDKHLFSLASSSASTGFPNAFNHSISTSTTPYHALRYALGLKAYYQTAFSLRYNPNGSLVNSHAGKIYIALIPKDTFLSQALINSVPIQNYCGQVPVGLRIFEELEVSFVAGIPASQVVYEQPLKFPRFDRNWAEVKHIMELKYGFNQQLYHQFQWLIRNTTLQSDERKKVIELLKEWLSAFHEVMLLKEASQQAKQRKGRLVYLDLENKPIHIPYSNPKARTGINDDGNRIKLLERLRYLLAEEFGITNNIPENLISVIEAKINDDTYLDRLRYTTKVTDNDDARRLLKDWKSTFQTNFKDLQRIQLVDANNLYCPFRIYSDLQMFTILDYCLSPVENCKIEYSQLPLINGHSFKKIVQSAIQQIIEKKELKFVIPICNTKESSPLWHIDRNITWYVLIISYQHKRLQFQWVDTINYKNNFAGPLDEYNIRYKHEIIYLITQDLIPEPYKMQARLLFTKNSMQNMEDDMMPWLIQNTISTINNKTYNTKNLNSLTLRKEHHDIFHDFLKATGNPPL